MPFIDSLLFSSAVAAEAGTPATGAWDTLCAWHINAAQHCPEERYGYSCRQFVKRQGVTRFELPEDDEGAMK